MTTKNELLKTIKFYCEECMGSAVAREKKRDPTAAKLVDGCTVNVCVLFPFRNGEDVEKTKAQNSRDISPGQ